MSPTLLPSPTDAETERLDALPRMSHCARKRTVPETRPEPGRYLVVEDGDEHRLLPLGPGATHIGRAWGAELRLEDQTVSRRHAIVVNDDDAVRILDDRSANGTRVNGAPVVRADLHDGDVIAVGRVALTFRELG
jgi:pSer/pThr/pTyr-binding forkhead associated (FHA) protein